MTEREFLERMDAHIEDTRRHMARGNELMDQIRQELSLNREEHRLNREEHRLNRAEHRRNQARFDSTRAVMREMVLEIREGREILADIRHGIQANTEGLLRVLDELRRDDGPDAVGA
jgi:hypothetical protein